MNTRTVYLLLLVALLVVFGILGIVGVSGHTFGIVGILFLAAFLIVAILGRNTTRTS